LSNQNIINIPSLSFTGCPDEPHADPDLQDDPIAG